MNKWVIAKAPPGGKFQAGAIVTATGAEADALTAEGYELQTQGEFEAINAREADLAAQAEAQKQTAEAAVKAAIVRAKERNAIPPKDEVAEATSLRELADLGYKPTGTNLVVKAIDAIPGKKTEALQARLTSSTEGTVHAVQMGDEGFRETIKAYITADQPFQKTLRQGGIVRAAHNDEMQMRLAIEASRERAMHMGRLSNMIMGGADLSVGELRNVVKATVIAVADETNIDTALGALSTGLLLQNNLGFLSYQLAPLDDVTTDISTQPVYYNQTVRTRYITVPKVMLKTDALSWGAGTPQKGTATDVNVTMNKYPGVPISIGNVILSSTPRQLFNEQRVPQLYALGQYIIYALLYNVWNGNIRLGDDGNKTTINFNPAYTNGAGGHTFSLAGATLATFVADLPEAMDESLFPGGDEEPGVSDLARFCWVHGRAYATAAADTNFILNQSIQGIRGQTTDNVMATGRFTRIGNMKFRKSQLCTDQVTATGSGADSGSNGIVITPGTFASATYIGFCGTRSSLLFVSRVPMDYTKVLPDVPSTAAIELVTEPRTGLTFMVVKYLDHAYETANMRVQLMFGTAVGDERQGMWLARA